MKVKNVGDRNIVSDGAATFPASIYRSMEWSYVTRSLSNVSLYSLWHDSRPNRLTVWSRVVFEKNESSQRPSIPFFYNQF